MPESQIKATYIHHCGSDLTVVNAARVSFGKKSSLEEDAQGVWRMDDKDVKLINYLAKHEHLSPFGHCFFTFHIKAPVFVRAQLVKHEYLRMNEISRRYVDEEPEFYTPDVWRGRSKDKKQGSSDTTIPDNGWYPDDFASREGFEYNNWGGEHFRWSDPVMALGVYKQMLECGVAPEMARMVLPQSMMTEWFWSGSLDAFFNMCRLRLKPDAQYETRLVATQVSETIKEHCPVSWAALMEHIK